MDNAISPANPQSDRDRLIGRCRMGVRSRSGLAAVQSSSAPSSSSAGYASCTEAHRPGEVKSSNPTHPHGRISLAWTTREVRTTASTGGHLYLRPPSARWRPTRVGPLPAIDTPLTLPLSHTLRQRPSQRPGDLRRLRSSNPPPSLRVDLAALERETTSALALREIRRPGSTG